MYAKLNIALAILFSVAVGLVWADRSNWKEDDWNQEFCAAGEAEVTLEVPEGSPGSRADCLTSVVWEMDWAAKSGKRDECLGQALRYSALTGVTPGCVLIVKSPDECRYVEEVRRTVEYWKLPVLVRTVGESCD